MTDLQIDMTLDAKGMNCPMPIQKTKKAVGTLSKDQVLKVATTDPGSKNDMVAWVKRTGNEILKVEESGGTFTPGQQTNGLRFGNASGGVINIYAGQTWKTNACLGTGIVGWGRFYDNARTQGQSTTAVRFDFSVGASGADLNARNNPGTVRASFRHFHFLNHRTIRKRGQNHGILSSQRSFGQRSSVPQGPLQRGHLVQPGANDLHRFPHDLQACQGDGFDQ